MKMLKTGAAALLALALAPPAQATLVDRGGGMVYDTLLDVTWLKNANYAATELSDARRDALIAAVVSVEGHTLAAADFQKSGTAYTGKMSWWGAMAWAQDLTFGGFSDWRLATINSVTPTSTIHGGLSPTAEAFAAFGNEYAYMFAYNLGGTAGLSGERVGDVTAVLGDVVLNGVQQIYWSATQFDATKSYFYVFGGNGGSNGEGTYTDDAQLAAWAVRSGDVAAAVPEPQTLALALLALVALGATGAGRSRPPASDDLPSPSIDGFAG